MTAHITKNSDQSNSTWAILLTSPQYCFIKKSTRNSP